MCKIIRLLVNTLTADGKYSLLNRDSLTQLIQMQLPQKQRFFSNFFSAFLRSSLNFEHFQKKITLIADAFPQFWTPKSMVRLLSKKSSSEDPSTSNMVNGPNHCWNLNDSTFIIFTDHCEGNIEWEKVSFSDMQNLKTVCEHIDCQWQVFSA